MSLETVASYRALEPTQLLKSFNQALTAIDSNLEYVLSQVSAPLPTPLAENVGQVVRIVNESGSYVPRYQSADAFVSVQGIFDTFLASGAQQLTLANSLSIPLVRENGTLKTISITGNPSTPVSPRTNYIDIAQTSISGNLSESHKVTSLDIVTETFTVTSSDPVEINKLKVGDYLLPSTIGTDGKVLQVVSGVLAFASIYAPFTDGADVTATFTTKALSLPSLGTSSDWLPSIKFGGQDVGIGFRDSTLFLKAGSGPVVDTPAMYGLTTRALRVKTALVLPQASTQSSAPELASLWFDPVTEHLVWQTSSGPVSINGTILTGLVNTVQTDTDFALASGSTMAVPAGSELAPSLRVGSSSGFSSTDDKLKITVGDAAVLELSDAGLLTGVASNTAAAALNLDSTVGLNSPTAPTYTFKSASGLGMFRAATNTLGWAASGVTVMTMTSSGLVMSSKKISGLATPTASGDAVSLGYLNTRLPNGSTQGQLSAWDTTSAAYQPVNAWFASGVLTVSSGGTSGTLRLSSSGGGQVNLVAPAIATTHTYTWPTTQVTNGYLKMAAGGALSWVAASTLLDGVLMADGSVEITSGLQFSFNGTPSAPTFIKGDNALYMDNTAIGFGYDGSRVALFEGSAMVMKGAVDTGAAPLIQLADTLVPSPVTAIPTYSFGGSTGTGLGQMGTHDVSLMSQGSAILSVTTSGINARSHRISNVTTPSSGGDAANKTYVDGLLARKQISFLVLAVPAGFTGPDYITLSLVDAALVKGIESEDLDYETASALGDLVVPTDFSTNANCQVFLNGVLLSKRENASSIREAARLSSAGLTLYCDVNVDDIITVLL